MGVVLLIVLLAGFLLVVGWLAVSEPRQAGTPQEPARPVRPADDVLRIIDLDAPPLGDTRAAERGRALGRIEELSG